MIGMAVMRSVNVVPDSDSAMGAIRQRAKPSRPRTKASNAPKRFPWDAIMPWHKNPAPMNAVLCAAARRIVNTMGWSRSMPKNWICRMYGLKKL